MLLEPGNCNRLIEFVLLNAYSSANVGIRNGKAGVALTLFELARQMKSDHLEVQAADLLQHALLSKDENISFMDGLGGIGIVLDYLIHHGYVEADYQKIFGSQQQLICQTLLSGTFRFKYPYEFSEYLLFINLTSRHIPEVIFKKLESFFIHQLHAYFSFVQKKELKKEEIGDFAYCSSLLLYLDNKCGRYGELVESIVTIYQKYELKYAAWNVGFYLCRLGLKSRNVKQCQIGGELLKYKISQAYPQLMEFRLKMNFIYYIQASSIVKSIPGAAQLYERIVREFAEKEPDLLELNIVDSIPHKNFYYGFGQGICRLLCLNAYWERLNKIQSASLLEVVSCY